MDKRKRSPLIGVTGPRKGGRAPRLCIALALRRLGARSLQLSPGDESRIGTLQGVVVSGGHDIEPTLYGAARDATRHYDPERDRYESIAIDAALGRDLPILGICRGAQLLNVRLGGTLHLDLRELRGGEPARRTLLPLKTLLVEPATRLRQLLGVSRTRINSLHHQSVNELGRHLVVSGRDRQGVVQAVEWPEARFCVGVQWHPEFLIYRRIQMALFAGLVRAAGHD